MILFLSLTLTGAFQPLKTKAFDYEDGTPWEKRTVNLTYYVSLNYSSGNGYGSGDGSFTIYNINTDEVIQPLNVRVSVSASKRGSSVANFRCSIKDPSNYLCFDSGVLSSPCVNYPIQLSRAGYQNYNIYCYGFSPDIDAVNVTITYDVYYKYESGGGETFTLPADWTQNTTAPPSSQVELPTVTTVATPSDASENMDNWLTIPTKITDCANFFGAVIINIFEMKYVTFLVLFGIFCAVLIWFLH